jgi:hypothetical protein
VQAKVKVAIENTFIIIGTPITAKLFGDLSVMQHWRR